MLNKCWLELKFLIMKWKICLWWGCSFLSHWNLFHSNNRIYSLWQMSLMCAWKQFFPFLKKKDRIYFPASLADGSGHCVLGKWKWGQLLPGLKGTSHKFSYPSFNLMPKSLKTLEATYWWWWRFEMEGSKFSESSPSEDPLWHREHSLW